MKILLVPVLLLLVFAGFGQCAVSIPLTAKPDNCLGTTLTVGQVAGLDYSKITWYNGANIVSVVNANPGSNSGITVAGGNGNGPAANQLVPAGLFIDGNGNMYVVDVDNSRVQKFIPGATSGITVAGGNGAGNAANQLNYPIGLAVDGSGNLYIADASNERIQKWAPGATSGITVAGGNGKGAAANQFNDPTRVVIDANGDLYIGDSQNNRVQKWAAGASSGITVAGGNGGGSAANQLYGVYGLALDKAGNIYISDNGNNRIQKWSPGSTSGTTVIGGTAYGSGLNQLGYPAGIFFDKDDNLYVGDYGNERVMKYAPGASSGVIVAGGNGQGNAANQFFEPEYSFIDDKGNLYVSDAFNFRVQKWTVPTIQRDYIPSTAGTYTALVETSNGCSITTGPQIVNALANPSISISTPNLTIDPCTQVIFTAQAVDGGTNPYFQWQINGINTGANLPSFTSAHLTDGDVIVCVLSSNAACALNNKAISNAVKIRVNGNIPASVTIKASSDKVCAGDPVQFTTQITNSGTTPSYQWKLNGRNVGLNSPDFKSIVFKNGDTVSCEVTFSNSCQTSLSNKIVMTVYPVPIIAKDQVFAVSAGQSLSLDPVITGNIQSYLWTPGSYLSDNTIRNPVASPPGTIEYLLKLISTDGCEASGKILVKVYSALKIPNAFSPNGDGENDVFNIIGGEAGSIINEFAVYNRWGQVVYSVKNKTPENNGGGWNGTSKGQPAPGGIYVYIINIKMPDGTKKTYRGSVLLIR